MKIKYKTKKRYWRLVIGLTWSIFGIFFLFFDKKLAWNDLSIIIGIVYLGIWIYEYINQYLTIENGFIKTSNHSSEKIKLTEIKQIEKLTDDYILKTDKAVLKINIQIIDKNSLAKLNTELEKLNVEWN